MSSYQQPKKASPLADSQARIIGVLADGYRLLLICNHLLDNTKHPKISDFTVSTNEESIPVKAVFMASPMLPNSSWAGITLMLSKMLPKSEEVEVCYQSPLGLISLVDKRRLQSFSVQAHTGNQDLLSSCQTNASSTTAVMDLEMFNEDPLAAQENMFFDYVDSLLGGGYQSMTDTVPTLPLEQQLGMTKADSVSHAQDGVVIPRLAIQEEPEPAAELMSTIELEVEERPDASHSMPIENYKKSKSKSRNRHFFQSLLEQTTVWPLSRVTASTRNK